MMLRVWVMAQCIAACSLCYSQFLPNLQARTPAEYNAYLDVLDGPVLENGLAFEREYPQSSLRLPVCELMVRAWRSQGDGKRAIAAAERGLTIAPDYIPLLVELADLLSNGSERLEVSVQAAGHALELLDRAKAPQRISPEEWTSAVAKLRSRAHAAIGMVRFKNDDRNGAIAAFQEALRVSGGDDPILHYRLGRLYALEARQAEARRALARAVESTDPALRELAQKALSELK